MLEFKLKTNVVLGAGVSNELGTRLKNFMFKKIGLIIDANVRNHVETQAAIKSLEAEGCEYQIFVSDAVEPDYAYLEEFKKKVLNQTYDCLVGIGGGSILDLTKGIATLVSNPGEAISFRGFPKLKNRPLPVVAMPTTAGTGSEATYFAVFTDSVQKKKLGINSELNFPVLAIIDPLFTVGCPKSVTVSSGVDALVHTLESYVAKKHTVASRMYSKEAFRLLYNNLSRVLDDPRNVEIRSELALGAYLAAVALMNSGSGPAGAFSYPLGVYYKVPHGYAGAIFLHALTEFNVEKEYRDYADLYDLIYDSKKSLSVKEKNLAFSDKIGALMEKLQVPQTLEGYDLREKDIEFLAGQYDGLKAAIDQNAINITNEDARAIVNKSLKKRLDYARI